MRAMRTCTSRCATRSARRAGSSSRARNTRAPRRPRRGAPARIRRTRDPFELDVAALAGPRAVLGDGGGIARILASLERVRGGEVQLAARAAREIPVQRL